MPKVRVTAEQLFHGRKYYVMGDVLEMDEASAKECMGHRPSVELVKEDVPTTPARKPPALDPAQVAMDEQIAQNKAKAEREAAEKAQHEANKVAAERRNEPPVTVIPPRGGKSGQGR